MGAVACRTGLLGISLILLGQVMIPTPCEVFTALVHMEELLDLEVELLASLNSYITAEKERLQELEAFSSVVSQAHGLYSGRPASTHLSDPVNAFQLVNRYSNGWLKLQENINKNNSKVKYKALRHVPHDQQQMLIPCIAELMTNISLNNHRLPTSDDFRGAITALHRLQETYKLPATSLSSGTVSAAPSLNMSAKDCFLVGQQAYAIENWLMSRDWLKEALNKYEGSGPGYADLDLALVYDHLAFSEYRLGNMEKAAQYTRDLLQKEPDHERALENMAFFDSLRIGSAEDIIDAESGVVSEGCGTIMDVYKTTCREGLPLPPSEHHKLTCYYFDNNGNPRLVVQPVKVEVVYPDPKIYILKDFLSDREMDRLKELAVPKLDRAAVNSNEGNPVKAAFRIGKSGWLNAGDDPQGFVARINQRIEDVTGLTMSTAEKLQVLNYGIAGQYDPHYDLSRPGETAFPLYGNRISTLLIYLSDVELGGATVFPLLGLHIPPSKGDAAFWWNLNKAGDGDLRTLHAGCPVLVGSKWVCNKWIHEHGQEFRRPCTLSSDH